MSTNYPLHFQNQPPFRRPSALLPSQYQLDAKAFDIYELFQESKDPPSHASHSAILGGIEHTLCFSLFRERH